MSAEETKAKLFDELSRMPVIDAHEHLPPEPERLALEVDIFTLFSHYTHADLISSGMRREDWERTQDASVPLEERWTSGSTSSPRTRSSPSAATTPSPSRRCGAT